MRKLLVVSWLVLATVLLQLTGTGMVWAGGRCPEMKGGSNPSDPSHVIQTFVDLLGCDVPLRQGVAHTPKQQGDFGLAHILARYKEGATNHESTPAAKVLWQRALLQAGAVRGPLHEVTTSSTKVREESGR